MILYSGLDLRMSKRQVKHVLKAHSGMEPIQFLPIKPRIILPEFQPLGILALSVD